MSTKIELDFHKEMLGIYTAAIRECGYRANRFRQMVLARGGVNAAKDLLHSCTYSEGLTKLWEADRVDISMEALVLREPWRSLFSDQELTVARTRLKELGYDKV